MKLLIFLFVSLSWGLQARAVNQADAKSNENASEKSAVKPEDVALSIGRSVRWPVAASGAISVSNGAIIRVVDEGHAIRVTALKLGASSVRSGFRTLDVNVIPESSYRIYNSLHEAIEDRRGLELSAAAGDLRIKGRLLRADDWVAIASQLSQAEPGKFQFAATLEPEVETAIRRELDTRLRSAGLEHVDIRFSPDAVATIASEPKDVHIRAQRVLAPFGIRVETTSSVLALAPMVRVKIVVAEIKKSFARRFGIDWTSMGSILQGRILPDFIVPTQPIEVALSAIESNGWGRMLASPNLLCRSGKEAEFMAGGEFPIRISSIRSSDVVWKNYGVLLRVKPVADVGGRMSIQIETEVSALDFAHSVDNIPAIYTNRMQTHFDLAKTRTIALSGLIKSEKGDSSAGLPWLGSIPILGSLFASRDFKDDRSELVIFVTPEVLRADDEDMEKNP